MKSSLSRSLHGFLRKSGVPAAKRIRWIKPQLATLLETPPEGGEWIHETKYDGYRVLIYIENERVTIWTRNQNNWTEKFNTLVRDIELLGLRNAILDGEIVVHKPGGGTSFQLLQNALAEPLKARTLQLYIFDIMHLDGFDLRPLPLLKRKWVLDQLFARMSSSRVHPGECLARNGMKALSHARKHGLEGIISKNAAAPYTSGRGLEWVKTKCAGREEFLVIGFTPYSAGRRRIGALLLGLFDDSTKMLRYCGKVGTGFSVAERERLYGLTAPFEQETLPFVNPTTLPPRPFTLVAPRLIAEIQFTEWTKDGLLRHPSYLGLREDKKTRQVRRKNSSLQRWVFSEERV